MGLDTNWFDLKEASIIKHELATYHRNYPVKVKGASVNPHQHSSLLSIIEAKVILDFTKAIIVG